MNKGLLSSALVISAVLLISVAGATSANAHPGKPENRCEEILPSEFGARIVCKEEPVVGQEVKITSIAGTVTHRPVIFVDTTFNQVAFDCGHFKDGTPILACSLIIYNYEVKGQ